MLCAFKVPGSAVRNRLSDFWRLEFCLSTESRNCIMNKTLAGEHTVLAYDQWNQHYHYVLPILLLSFYYVVNFMRQNVGSVDAPVIGYRSMFEPGWLLGVRFVRGSAPIIRDGYAKVFTKNYLI